MGMFITELNTLLLLLMLGVFGRLKSHVGRAIAGPASMLICATIHTIFAVAMKWIVIGKMTPGHRPMWSKNCFLARFDLIGRIMHGLSAHAWHGTPFANLWLRVLGVTVGKDVFIWDSAGVGEPDMDLMELSDGACLTEVASWCHLMEDRVMKNDWVKIGKNASVQADAQLLPGNSIGDGALVVAGAVVPKGEQVPAYTRCEGHPSICRNR